MSQETARHPFTFGTFKTLEEEIRAARGLPSSHDFEREALIWEHHAAISAATAADYGKQAQKLEEIAAQLIAEDEMRRAEVETIKADMKRHLEEQMNYHEAITHSEQRFVEERRQWAQRARAFEARWSFNPYVDRLLDSMERIISQGRAAATRQKRGSRRPKAQSRAKP